MRPVIATVAAFSLVLAVPALPAQAAAPKLTSYGYGKIKIGQSRAKALKTGVIKLTGHQGNGCTSFKFKNKPVTGYLSNKYGVVALFAGKKTKTPEGIGLRSTKKAVKKAYPKLQDSPNISWTPAPKNKKAHYIFLFSMRDKVDQMGLAHVKQHCFN